jgi:diguanylate cyclase (GGDEF)-like protein
VGVTAGVLLLGAPGAAVAGPIGDALGDVSSALSSSPQSQPPQVQIGGDGLPTVTIGGGTATPPPSSGGSGGSNGSGGGSTSSPASGPSTSSPARPAPSEAPSASVGPNVSSAQGQPSGTRAGATAEHGVPTARNTNGAAAGGGGKNSKPNGTTNRRPPRAERNGSVAERIVGRIPARFRAALLVLAALSTGFALMSVRERRRSRRLAQDALADPLTGLVNRQGFETQLSKEWKRAQRYGNELGILLLDLDNFKDVNDTHGHVVGDRVLREAAAVIAGRVRETDMPARLGGDEFVVICPETAAAGLHALATGLSDALESHSIAASVGFAQREPGDTSPSDLIARADRSMYGQKRNAQPAAPGESALATA